MFTLFKHEKNNQTLSNDWPTYCHTGIHLLLIVKEFRPTLQISCTILHASGFGILPNFADWSKIE
jgi:hypothetical protein